MITDSVCSFFEVVEVTNVFNFTFASFALSNIVVRSCVCDS